MRTIKKYANRKIYDTTEKVYISLDRVLELIQAGEDVAIVDNTSGRDITASVVSRLLARNDPQRERNVPSGLLISLLRKGGGTLADYSRRYAALWRNALTLAEDEIDKRINRLVSDRTISGVEGKKLKNEIVAYTENIKSLIREKMDQRVNEVLERMHLAHRETVDQLFDEVERLRQKVKRLETVL